MEASSSSGPPLPLCSICNHRYSIYTCPRCSVRTCSLPCSSTHKSSTGCSGQRDKVAFVPMNEYKWGTMMNDYVLLEEMGRKVGDWGNDIARGGFETRGAARGGRGGHAPRNHNKAPKTKRDILKMELEAQDITMDLLPMGMERRKLNQSIWDFKSSTALLTIEFVFHPPLPLETPPITILTHRNNLSLPLLDILQGHVRERVKKKDKESEIDKEWLRALVIPPPEDPETFTVPQCVIAAQVDPLVAMKSRIPSYHKLDPSKPLVELLRNTQFVEYPTLDIWEEFRGVVVNENGMVKRQHWEEEDLQLRQAKRRKVDLRDGKKAMQGLLGGYGSEEEELESPSKDILAVLGDYDGSDDEEVAIEAESDEEEQEVPLDAETLLALVKDTQGRDTWDEDAVDWGDSDQD